MLYRSLPVIEIASFLGIDSVLSSLFMHVLLPLYINPTGFTHAILASRNEILAN